ncbi:putative na+/h+ antiporter [Desulfoluna spongiiphila]|nr:putative na+/h+ antiporter [Desulfoluna spongiiphila]
MEKRKLLSIVLFSLGIVAMASLVYASGGGHSAPSGDVFPRALDSYGDAHASGILEILKDRVVEEPFNLVASLIFLFAIIHTFVANKFLAIAHKWEHEHQAKIERGDANKYSVSHGAELFHFLGEVEAIFGIWAIALAVSILGFYDWHTLLNYLGHKVNFTEPMFVVVIMTLASTRPILKLAEGAMWKIANLAGGTLIAWWFTILTFGPLLGSFITEPAAMTISALLLSAKFYDLNPSEKFKYATIGLLFVNISVGGTLTHFAAPPVLMVASPWDWGMMHMLTNFGWKALTGILISNVVYFLLFKKEFNKLQEKFELTSLKEEIGKRYFTRENLEQEFSDLEHIISNKLGFTESFNEACSRIKERTRTRLREELAERIERRGTDPELVREAFNERFEEIKRREMRKTIPGLMPHNERANFYDPEWDKRDDPVPIWVIVVHVLFMVWTILNAHYPALFVCGMLFFLGFAQVTSPFQNRIDLKPALLVGFFLGGLVIHGGVQGWWIAPVLGNLGELTLMICATVLTAFNDNAAITFLSTLVPNFTDPLKYAVVAGAVAGGGMTVIANAPNPAGQAILKKYFKNGVNPGKLAMAAFFPTVVVVLAFLLL